MRRTARGVCLLGCVGALFAPTAPLAAADDSQPSPDSTAAAGHAQSTTPPGPLWVKGPYGKLFPVGGWKNCAEAQARGEIPVKRGEPGYNPVLDPTGSGIECT